MRPMSLSCYWSERIALRAVVAVFVAAVFRRILTCFFSRGEARSCGASRIELGRTIPYLGGKALSDTLVGLTVEMSSVGFRLARKSRFSSLPLLLEPSCELAPRETCATD